MPGDPVAKMKASRLRRSVRFPFADQAKEIAGILLGNKDQGTLRAYMVLGSGEGINDRALKCITQL
jgi:hypothetical protein